MRCCHEVRVNTSGCYHEVCVNIGCCHEVCVNTGCCHEVCVNMGCCHEVSVNGTLIGGPPMSPSYRGVGYHNEVVLGPILGLRARTFAIYEGEMFL